VNRRVLLHSRSFHLSARALMSLLLVAVSGCSGSSPTPGGAENRPRAIELLNVSYDPTRELYRDINAAFAKHYEQEHGTPVSIKQSHAASGSQSRAVIDGLDADVVTLATWPDIEAIAKSGLLRPDWQNRYENNSIPYHSVVVFVVRKGNPKNVLDWADLDRDDISIITPNPKTSGNGKYSFLAAWGAALAAGGSEDDAVKVINDAKDSYRISIEGFAGRVKEYLDSQPPGFRLNFFVDEAGQFIGDAEDQERAGAFEPGAGDFLQLAGIEPPGEER
jgi:sulfate transport system substrate-binding protein